MTTTSASPDETNVGPPAEDVLVRDTAVNGAADDGEVEKEGGSAPAPAKGADNRPLPVTGSPRG